MRSVWRVTAITFDDTVDYCALFVLRILYLETAFKKKKNACFQVVFDPHEIVPRHL